MSNEDTNNKEGEEMFRYVLSMTLFGGLIGCGGGDSTPPGGGAVAGEDEGTVCKADAADGCAAGEGEGSPNDGEGSSEGEGEGPLPTGADGEPCGAGNTCRDGLSCLTCEEGNVESVPDPRSPGDTKSCEGRICTCPQWFEGRWWAEFTEVRRTDGQEYDFMAPGLDRQFWEDQEVIFEQDGCTIRSTAQTSIFWRPGSGNGNVRPPDELTYKLMWDMEDNQEHLLRSSGQISEDRRSIHGTCAGEYLDWGRLTLFPITCTFTLTRR